ncbi:MAG: hypothetical protein KDB53_09730 [Planctomycetes bacterium]|nr:hypothetical protein [Planctomycetota bacterium]
MNPRSVLLVLVAITTLGFGQDDPPKPTPQATTIELVVQMLEIGIEDAQIIGYCEQRGWPEKVDEDALLRTRRAGADAELQRRLYGLMDRKSEPERLAKLFERFDTKIDGRQALSMLKPRGFEARAQRSGRRLSFHENDVAGWFRGVQYFVWIEDLGSWRAQNDGAVARVAAQASLDRLGRSGVTVGALDEDRLSDRQGVGRRPFYHALCRDDATQVSGFFGITATVDEAAGRILILGFTAPVLEDTAAVERARSRLMDMVEHLRLAPAATTTPNR